MQILPKRRRLENKTNYSKRLRLLEGRKPRVVIRKTNKYIIIQYVESKAAQDAIKASVTSKDLLKHGWPIAKAGSLKSLGACYLAGILFGNKVKKLVPAILDTGLIRSTKGSKIYAAVKGINETGFNLPCNEKVMPEESRIKTENLKEFFDKVKSTVTKEIK